MESTARRPLAPAGALVAGACYDASEVGALFRRRPEFIERVSVIRLLREAGARGQPGLRPLERRILRWREHGADFDEIAARVRRSPHFTERVVDIAQLDSRRGR